MNDSIFKTFAVAAGVCVVCSVLVSVAATSLAPIQDANALLDRQKNVIKAAGLVERGEKLSAAQIAERFGKVEQVVVDLATGDVKTDVAPEKLDLERQLKDPAQSTALSAAKDLAGIKAIPNETVVYLVRGDDGAVKTVALPIYGRGLWSTMYGFLALEGDLKTVASLSFYKHGETPGLGGEISNEAKMAKWTDKSAFDESGKPAVHFKKGTVSPDDPNAGYEVDGFSGATLTCDGVNRTVAFWLGENGFGPYLSKLKIGSPNGDSPLGQN